MFCLKQKYEAINNIPYGRLANQFLTCFEVN